MTVALGAARVAGPSARRWVLWLLAAGQILLAVSLAWRWLCVTTYRLPLAQRLAPETSAPARARQRFEVRDGRGQPEILTNLPPYLNRLRLSRADLEASPGWQLTRRSLLEMDRLV